MRITLHCPSHALRDHFDGGAIEERFRFFGGQGDDVACGKAGGDLDAGQILQGELNRLFLDVTVDDFENVRLALVDAQSVALQGEDIVVLGDHDSDADVDVGQQAQIGIVNDACGLAYVS